MQHKNDYLSTDTENSLRINEINQICMQCSVCSNVDERSDYRFGVPYSVLIVTAPDPIQEKHSIFKSLRSTFFLSLCFAFTIYDHDFIRPNVYRFVIEVASHRHRFHNIIIEETYISKKRYFYKWNFSFALSSILI